LDDGGGRELPDEDLIVRSPKGSSWRNTDAHRFECKPAILHASGYDFESCVYIYQLARAFPCAYVFFPMTYISHALLVSKFWASNAWTMWEDTLEMLGFSKEHVQRSFTGRLAQLTRRNDGGGDDGLPVSHEDSDLRLGLAAKGFVRERLVSAVGFIVLHCCNFVPHSHRSPEVAGHSQHHLESFLHFFFADASLVLSLRTHGEGVAT
jgi:hypothetical protein